MTFVKTRLLIEKMGAGETAEIHLVGEEPIENVPASVLELGHLVLSLEPVENKVDAGPNSIHCLSTQVRTVFTALRSENPDNESRLGNNITYRLR